MLRYAMMLAFLANAAAYYSSVCVEQMWQEPSGPDDRMCCWTNMDFTGESMSDGSVGTGVVVGYGVLTYDTTPDEDYDIWSRGIVRDRCLVSFNPAPTRWSPMCHSDATESTDGCYLSDGAGGTLIQVIQWASEVLSLEWGEPQLCSQDDFYLGQRKTPAVDVSLCEAGCSDIFQLTSTQGYAQPIACNTIDDLPLDLYSELRAALPTVVFRALSVVLAPLLYLVGL